MNQTTIRLANDNDLRFILHLQRQYSEQLGYIPRQPTEAHLLAGNILLAETNDDDTGFLLILPGLAHQPTTAAIIQAAIRLDAQRQTYGLQLVTLAETAARQAGKTIIQAACRANLEANLFWKAAGYQITAYHAAGHKRRNQTLLWRKALTPNADLDQLPPAGKPRATQGRFCTPEDATPWLPFRARPSSLIPPNSAEQRRPGQPGEDDMPAVDDEAARQRPSLLLRVRDER